MTEKEVRGVTAHLPITLPEDLLAQLEAMLDTPPQPNEALTKLFETYPVIPTVPTDCIHCGSHPSNGGSGICNCTLDNTTVVTC